MVVARGDTRALHRRGKVAGSGAKIARDLGATGAGRVLTDEHEHARMARRGVVQHEPGVVHRQGQGRGPVGPRGHAVGGRRHAAAGAAGPDRPGAEGTPPRAGAQLDAVDGQRPGAARCDGHDRPQVVGPEVKRRAVSHERALTQLERDPLAPEGEVGNLGGAPLDEVEQQQRDPDADDEGDDEHDDLPTDVGGLTRLAVKVTVTGLVRVSSVSGAVVTTIVPLTAPFAACAVVRCTARSFVWPSGTERQVSAFVASAVTLTAPASVGAPRNSVPAGATQTQPGPVTLTVRVTSAASSIDPKSIAAPSGPPTWGKFAAGEIVRREVDRRRGERRTHSGFAVLPRDAGRGHLEGDLHDRRPGGDIREVHRHGPTDLRLVGGVEQRHDLAAAVREGRRQRCRPEEGGGLDHAPLAGLEAERDVGAVLLAGVDDPGRRLLPALDDVGPDLGGSPWTSPRPRSLTCRRW